MEKHEIKLQDCQVDLLLKCLELYLYNYSFFIGRKKESENKEENLKLSLARDTYEQINSQIILENKAKKLIKKIV